MKSSAEGRSVETSGGVSYNAMVLVRSSVTDVYGGTSRMVRNGQEAINLVKA
jgi:hypothetical protein